MRLFISHASDNQDVVLKFASFLESISSEIEVICTSDKGSIQHNNYIFSFLGK